MATWLRSSLLTAWNVAPNRAARRNGHRGAVVRVGAPAVGSVDGRDRRSTPCGGATDEAPPRRRSTSGHPTAPGVSVVEAGDAGSSATARHATHHLGGCDARSGTVPP